MKRRRPRFSRAAGLARVFFCLAVVHHGFAHANYRGRMYYLERPKLGVDLSYRFDTEKRSSPSSPGSKLDTQVLTERIDLETEGWVYHPAMALVTLRLSPEWRQTTDQPHPGAGRSSDSFLLGYGVDATLLPYKPYTVDVYARKQSSVVTTSLAPVTESETDAYGATLRLKYKVLPTNLSYAHATTEQTGFYAAHEERDEVRLNMRHDRKDSDTRFDLSQVARDRTAAGASLRNENLYGSLINNYRFDPRGRVLLGSMLTYRDTRTDVSSSSGYALSETLNWRHTKRFSTNYNVQRSHDDNDGLKIDRTLASAGLAHFLYENLTTTASVSGSESSQGDSNFGGNLNLAYQRRIPWGMITASLGQDYRINKPGEGLIRTSDAFGPLLSGDLVQLTNRDLASVISVRVATSTNPAFVDRTLIAGIDYTLDDTHNPARITLHPLGLLLGETVSIEVTYDYQSPNFDSATHGQSFGVGLQLWDAWRINYRYAHSEQEFLAGIRPEVLAADTRHTLDSDFKWRWSTTRFQYEDSDSTTGLSMTRWRLEEGVHFRPTPTDFLAGSAYYGRTTLKDSGAEDSFHGLRADYQRLLSGNSRVKFEALYAAIDGSTVKTLDKGVMATWEWTWGIWRADATYRYLNQEDRNSGQTRDRHTLFFGIRRSLF